MDLVVGETKRLGGEVKAPSSKSYTIRALLSALLCEGEVLVRDVLVSRDTQACMNVCENLGGRLRLLEDDSVKIRGVAGTPEPQRRIIDCMNSGTTLRLAAAIASLSKKPVRFTGDASLRSRPIQPLVDALSKLGVKGETVNGKPPVKIIGPLHGGETSLPGDVSSQFVSGLLMACPLAEKDTKVEITTELKSKPYVDLTIDVLEKFQIQAENQGYRRFHIPGGQMYESNEYRVEGDYSSAAFLLAAASLTEGEVTVLNLNRESLQGDKKIIDILEKMGAEIEVGDNSVTVKGGERLDGVEVDLSDTPDLLPIVSVLGVCSSGETRIVNTEHARMKECDRIKAMATELKKMDADLEEKRDGLLLRESSLNGREVDGWRDHRIIMSLGVAGLKAAGETRVKGVEHIDVTYPGFIDDMRKLGAGLR